MDREARQRQRDATQGGVGLHVLQEPPSPEDQQAEDERRAEAERLFAEADQTTTSPIITMGVLAHQWFTIAQQREASRMTQGRFLKMQKAGRRMGGGDQRDGSLRQFAETTVELGLVEEQIVEVLQGVAAQEGPQTALALLATSHMNFTSDVTVRFPPVLQAQVALAAGLIPADGGPGLGANPQDPSQGKTR